jgi:superfamily II DNA or RNA helicase
MDAFPANVQFRRPWRGYQQRVLGELKQHLDDNHLHVIAAPGSGKTVLGLEVMRRLNRPTLILSPTVAIQDQWVDRFVGLFMDHGHHPPDWISKDIRNPRFITASTYQGLHSVYSDDSQGKSGRNAQTGSRIVGKDALLERLKQLGVRTLVLDEAHHLRNEWWKCLADLKEQLGKPTVVALTATAPFDVAPIEWDRYIGLCGPIDAEISVPELVQQKNLCPHQDYAYMSSPLRAEQQEIREFRKDVDEFVQRLCADQEFINALESQPCVSDPWSRAEQILDDPAFYSSIASFLSHIRGNPPRKLLRVIGLSPRRCPKLDLEQLETLLAGCLYTYAKSFDTHKNLFQRIGRDAKRIGAAERREISLRSTARVARLLIRSASKLKSIEDIVTLESETLGADLRMVILTDFIRRADFPANGTDLKPVKRLGVVPIFEQIRRSRAGEVRLGILSGTLTIVPSQSCETLRAFAPEIGLNAADVSFKPLPHDPRFCEVTIPGADKHKMVSLITGLFNRGGITVLVGTTSLLGEGWDAPSVNSLILASFVGSYMLSNQMRGRAIRTQEGNPSKTANIWHLVCQEEDAKEFNEDMETLTRRFKSFAGVSFTGDRIESGLERLGLGQPPYSKTRMEHLNGAMMQKARDRARLITEWEQALGSDETRGMMEQVAASPLALPRDFIFRTAILAVLWQACCWGAAVYSFLTQSAQQNSQNMTFRAWLLVLAIISAVAALAALPKCLKALWLFLWHGSVASSMKQIGKVIVRSLAQADLIETNPWRLKVTAQRQESGFVSCSLRGATTRERSIFLEAIQEVLGPIENPRYVIVRKTPLGWLVRNDYHAVPTPIGRNKESAQYFQKMWARHVGPTQLVYTRTPEGRRFLLKARAHSMAKSFQKRAERLRSWQ